MRPGPDPDRFCGGGFVCGKGRGRPGDGDALEGIAPRALPMMHSLLALYSMEGDGPCRIAAAYDRDDDGGGGEDMVGVSRRCTGDLTFTPSRDLDAFPSRVGKSSPSLSSSSSSPRAPAPASGGKTRRPASLPASVSFSVAAFAAVVVVDVVVVAVAVAVAVAVVMVMVGPTDISSSWPLLPCLARSVE